MTFQGANRVEGPDCHVSYDRKLQPSMILRFILLSLIPLAALIASGATEDCHYKFPKKINPRRVRLCSSQLPQWGNDPEVEASLPALHNSSLFCSTKSVVLNFFSLVNVSIDLTHSRSDVLRIERSCDLVISVTNGLTFYKTFHSIKNKPLVLAYPSNKSDVLLTWSDKLRWKQWMIGIGLGHYVAKSIDLSTPSFPFILKATLSEGDDGSKGIVFVVQDQQELQSRLTYFKENNITRYFGEEALTGMGRLHGVVYLSAFKGRLLSVQCYLYKFRDLEDPVGARQRLDRSVFLSGVGGSADGPKPRPTVYRVNYDEGDLATTLRKVAKKAQFSGVMCIKFKMNPFGRIVFLGFEPSWCRDLQRIDTVFMEAYLPLAFYTQAYIRRRLRNTDSNSAYSERLQRIVDGSHVWFDDKSIQQLAAGYSLSSKKNKAMTADLPTISLFDLSFS